MFIQIATHALWSTGAGAGAGAGRTHLRLVCYQRPGLPCCCSCRPGRPWLARSLMRVGAWRRPTNGQQSPSVPRRTDHITRLSISYTSGWRGGAGNPLSSTRPRGLAVVSAAARVSQGRLQSPASNIRRLSGGEILLAEHTADARCGADAAAATTDAACCYCCSRAAER